MNSWTAILGVLVVIAASMWALSALGRSTALSGETIRKALHVEMGLVTLTFPWLFSEPWPVVLIAGAAIGGFGLLGASRWLEFRFGRALHGAGRDSRGAAWFACGVCLAYLASAGRPLHYGIAILVLAFADSAAALVGRRYGQSCRMPGGAHKSAAGSAAFFAVALTVVLAGLQLGGGMPPIEALATAFLVAAVTTALEAILADGLDNLCVPLATLAILDAGFAAFPAMWVPAGAALASLLFVLLWRPERYS